jgi:hypothetical protein
MNKRNKIQTTESGPSTQASVNTPHVAAALRVGDIESDAGLRKPTKQLDPDIRDLARREYIMMKTN